MHSTASLALTRDICHQAHNQLKLASFQLLPVFDILTCSLFYLEIFPTFYLHSPNFSRQSFSALNTQC